MLCNGYLFTYNVKTVHKKIEMQLLYETDKDIMRLMPSVFTQRA